MLTYLNLDEILKDDIKLSESDFICKIKEQKSHVQEQLSDCNLKKIYAKIQNKSDGDFSDLDFIKMLAIKLLDPNLYKSKYHNFFINSFNSYMGDAGYTFDPVKNGQNIIKHEVSFMKIMGFINSTYIFPIDKENKNNTDRIMITICENLPYLSVGSSEIIDYNSKIRLISSRRLSRTDDDKNLKSIREALKRHYDEPLSEEIIKSILNDIKIYIATPNNTDGESSEQ